MRFPKNKRVKALAVFVMFAVAQISVQLGFAESTSNNSFPVPQQYIARLRTRGNNPITVNNNAAATGASLVTGALIETGNDQAATIDIGDFRLDIAPNTRLRLDYDDQGRIKVFLIAGCIIAASRGKTKAEVETADNVKQGETEEKRGGAIDICFINGVATVNQSAAANAGAGAGATATAAGAGGGLSTPVLVGIVLGVVGATVVTIVAVNQDDGEESQSNPSPSSPSQQR